MSASLFSDRYTSAEQLERERRTVFRKTWVIACRDDDVALPGACLPFDDMGRALILVRGKDGVARSFVNTCRHRGTRILSQRCRVDALTCPYHGWRYGLDGKLNSVPAAEGFENLDLDAHGLIPVRTESFAGFVWITLDAASPPLREYLGAVVERLAPYRLEAMRRIGQRTWTLPCNWKAFLDNHQESYHVTSVHRMWSKALSVGQATYHDLGDHHLFSVSMGKSNRWREALDRLTMPAGLSLPEAQRGRYQKYMIFPNTLIGATPHQTTVFRIFPIDVDSCRFQYEFYIPDDASALARLRGRLTQLASLRFAAEDNTILGVLQRGLAASGSRVFPLHQQELALAHLHRVVDRYVAEQ